VTLDGQLNIVSGVYSSTGTSGVHGLNIAGVSAATQNYVTDEATALAIALG